VVEIAVEGDHAARDRVCFTPAPIASRPSALFHPLRRLRPAACRAGRLCRVQARPRRRRARHAGIETDVKPLVDARGAGRRRATLHASSSAAGYMRARSHELLDIDACPILVPALRETAPRDRARDRRLPRRLRRAGDCDRDGDRRRRPHQAHCQARKARAAGAAAGLGRLSRQRRDRFQLAAPVGAMGKAQVELPVGSFLQATEEAEEALAALVIEGVGKAKSVADLFCGIGPFALGSPRARRSPRSTPTSRPSPRSRRPCATPRG
jgi:23S rRNA (uracil1939-C5)-methyltransferase